MSQQLFSPVCVKVEQEKKHAALDKYTMSRSQKFRMKCRHSAREIICWLRSFVLPYLPSFCFSTGMTFHGYRTYRNNSQFKYALNYRSLNCSVVVVNPHTLPCSSHSPIAVNCLRHIAFLILSTNLFPFSHSCVFFFSLIRGHL